MKLTILLHACLYTCKLDATVSKGDNYDSEISDDHECDLDSNIDRDGCDGDVTAV